MEVGRRPQCGHLLGAIPFRFNGLQIFAGHTVASDERIRALARRAYGIAAELRQACDEANRGSCGRQTIGRLARDLRQRMYDLEVLAA